MALVDIIRNNQMASSLNSLYDARVLTPLPSLYQLVIASFYWWAQTGVKLM